jgi:trehalose utilization protein
MGLCWTVGKGRVFYFTPGHETYNDFFRDDVRQILRNAVEWAGPRN